jgi:PQQ system protein
MATLTPDRASLFSELGLDTQNKAGLGRIIANGPIATAEEGPDGRMRAQIRIPPDELVFDPSILVVPHGGDLQLEIVNDDTNTHCAHMPSNGDNKWMWLPVYS